MKGSRPHKGRVASRYHTTGSSRMTQPAPPMISVLREQGHCVGAEPRGFQAYGAAGQPLGLFQDKQAAVTARTAGQGR